MPQHLVTMAKWVGFSAGGYAFAPLLGGLVALVGFGLLFFGNHTLRLIGVGIILRTFGGDLSGGSSGTSSGAGGGDVLVDPAIPPPANPPIGPGFQDFPDPTIFPPLDDPLGGLGPLPPPETV